ncbi:peptidase T [Tuwongella immobilis]|uniref:Peptidase T n=1 Tax=Tuwongella immobilis TaxID=692036 RepID=A0A6C2YXZ1_9BACT|nr:peptidase T [Tuwongella immobilis]VIP05719.1 peptidase t : Peptidase T OS=Pirellula staleyi (strain ATCC 27377 / DSM 6068 / ICPB 4128) GN=Psta_1386 PE=4 SV=1: Peptidase_M20: M20_dimer [Tuwongella immobilis]VTS08794.1 peptidase t : Peptidase T OS=Pirellula staleyi (strain ATCC 27377 / DSM 6068 / ICPB 4128) GN=Psta_1386 PE=4 SV=1: Peptidase_M20: M20_dimer [Tuwongella immobilis]
MTASIDTAALLDRFLRYVKIDTQADEAATHYPSTPGQLELGRLLVDELKAMGLADAHQTEWGIVYATIPATISTPTPVIAWIAHVDTSPETTGKNVRPQVVTQYQGQPLVLPGNPNKVIDPADNPELLGLIGKTIITTDGTTLLGADNKAGVAVMMQAAATLLAHPEIPHGPIRLCFTCDEEIGKGIAHVEPAELGAVVAYTLDGAAAHEIEAETFSADKATITVRGVNIHPSIGKGKMVNAVRLAAMVLERLPKATLSPETTDGRDGFIHPYQISGGVAEVTIGLLLRDFVTAKLADQADMLRQIAREVESTDPRAKIEVEIKPQYRNMADGIAKDPRAIALADEAHRRIGITPIHRFIRGGTDGALLTAKGVPTPNLSTGEHNPHSPLEWTCLEEMESAVAVLVSLAQVWGEQAA